MKKQILGLALLASGALFIGGCQKFDNGDDNLADGTLTINYAVQVVPIGDAQKGLANASVTIQSNGKTETKTTDANGIVVFENIKAGHISGYVTSSGFASINFSANIAKTNIDASTTDYATSTVSMIATNATLKARIYGDYNNDGVTDPTDSDDLQAATGYVVYAINNYPMGTGTGALTSVSLDTDTYAQTTGADGQFNLSGLPVTYNGYLSAEFFVADILDEDDNNNDFYFTFNYGPSTVNLIPEGTTELNDIMVN